MKNPFKIHLLARCYDDVMKAARDNFSNLYVSPKIIGNCRRTYGPNMPHKGGSALHHAFWNGWASDRPTTIPQSMAHAAWRAGRNFRKERATK